MADENRTPTPTGDNMAPPQGAQLGPDDEPRRINLTFNGSNGESVAFKVKSTMKLGKAMDHYSVRVQTDPQQLRFLFDGTRLEPGHTPADLDMEDNDIIEVHMEQIGGAGDGSPVFGSPIFGSPIFKPEEWVDLLEDDEVASSCVEHQAREKLNAELVREQHRLRDHTKAYVRAKTDFKEQAAKLKFNISELQEENAQIIKENDILEAAANNQVRSLKSTADNLMNINSHLEATGINLLAQVNDLEKANIEHVADKKKLSESNGKLKAEVQQLFMTNQSLKADSHKLNKANIVLKNKNEDLQQPLKKYADLQTYQQVLSKENAVLKGKNMQLLKSSADLQAKNAQLAKEHQNMKVRNQELLLEVTQRMGKIQALAKNTTGLKATVQSLGKEKLALKKLVAAKDVVNEALKQENSEVFSVRIEGTMWERRYFAMTSNVPLRALFEDYANYWQVGIDRVTFMSEDKKTIYHPKQTAKEADIQDNDLITAYYRAVI